MGGKEERQGEGMYLTLGIREAFVKVPHGKLAKIDSMETTDPLSE